MGCAPVSYTYSRKPNFRCAVSDTRGPIYFNYRNDEEVVAFRQTRTTDWVSDTDCMVDPIV